MAIKAVALLAVFLAICGVCPPSAAFSRLPKSVDRFNFLLRVLLLVGYLYYQLTMPGHVKQLTSKTYKVALLLTRLVLVAFQLVAWASASSIAKAVGQTRRMLLISPMVLVPGGLQILLICFYPFVWRNPLSSVTFAPFIFLYLALGGSALVVTLQTVLNKIYLQKLRSLHAMLVASPKRPVDLEESLAQVARKRARLNRLVADVSAGLGPVVTASVVTLGLRLAFSLFTNFSVGLRVFVTGELPSVSIFILLYPRTVLKSILLACLAHSGQRLNDEAVQGNLLLDEISTSHKFLAPGIKYQLKQCRLTFALHKIQIVSWGFFSVDHTLIVMLVGMIFSLVLIQVQFEVSEVVTG